MTGIVIVGTGIAGISAAERLRAEGYDGTITVLGDEPHLPYRRTVLSKDLFHADLREHRITLRPSSFWVDKGIDVITGVTVCDADADERVIRCDDGTTLGWDALILATGAVPVRPGWLHDSVPTLRTRADAEQIRLLLRGSDAVTIIGAGLIGLELAASAAAAGLDVTVCEYADRVMARALPPVISDHLAALHRAHGVSLRTGVRVVTADPDTVALRDGTHIPGPVVAAIGVQPDAGLARRLGADLGQTGIVVDDFLRSSVPGVYAAGDVAAIRHALTGEPSRAEHWLSATDQGKAVADSVLSDLTGVAARPYIEVPLAWTVQYGSNFQIVGRPGDGHDVVVDGSVSEGDATVVVRDGPRAVGAVAIGRPAAGRAFRADLATSLREAGRTPVTA
ncbi:NAD(P)/FAD-dependent oxidoreductase [Gordonia insulae]|uniref:Rhodocoxin reductase n=1 Tax=Gordonia insulae TaxID=2420509 RepID=A0A3G8JUH2_9ACTN|nr:FAD-dependent oxidoreductase [Gordonia insulae]AZG48536.1 Rhodocoxin reductase [Gordonia insulae]